MNHLKLAPAPMGVEGAAKEAHQLYQETPWEKKIRELGNYAEIEAKMPLLTSRKKASIWDKLSSVLGERNPLSHPVNPNDHSVWLFDNTAYRSSGSKDYWNVEVVAAYFAKDTGDDASEAVAKLSEVLGIAKDSATRQTIAARLQPFLDCVLPAHTVQLRLENQTFKLGPSSSEGITSDVIKFKSRAKGGAVGQPSLVELESAVPPVTFFAEETGWAIISDIDDTIKRTMTGSALGVLQTTFIDTPRPIEGMPELYHHIAQTFDNPPFWYLSASPYNLYAFLREFLLDMAKFPAGSLILRDASWMSLAGLLASVTQGTQAYKTDRMRKIHKWFPKRTFICIGDSTQTDPESYGAMYRENKGWIAAIFIRKVTGVSEVDMNHEKNKPERFQKAFKDVPEDVWYVFEDPQELYEKLDTLKKKKPHHHDWQFWK
jgi:phosphatidate phosphatase APP1